MDEEKLHFIAAESDDIRTERTALKQKLADLKAGERILDLQARKSGKSMLFRITTYASVQSH